MSPLTQNNFTFMKDTIYKEPEETVRYANKSKAGRPKQSMSPQKPQYKSKGMKKVKLRPETPKQAAGKTTPQSETSTAVSSGGYSYYCKLLSFFIQCEII